MFDDVHRCAGRCRESFGLHHVRGTARDERRRGASRVVPGNAVAAEARALVEAVFDLGDDVSRSLTEPSAWACSTCRTACIPATRAARGVTSTTKAGRGGRTSARCRRDHGQVKPPVEAFG